MARKIDSAAGLIARKVVTATCLGRNTFNSWDSEMARINLYRGGNPNPNFIKKSKRTKPKKRKK